MDAWETQLRRGLVELGVLAVLRDGEAYGYAIVERLAEVPGLAVTESTVYPLLARLAKDGFLAARMASSPNGPSRRYYRLSERGRTRLALITSHWGTVRTSMDHILKGGER